MIVLYEELKELLISQKRPNEEIDDIDRAFEFAQKLHSGQYRVSEEPYIVHPIEVAKILAELKLDKSTIIAAFLHDILEDTETKPEEIQELFGEDVLTLVQGVTKLGKYQFESTQDRQAENFRKMLLAMAKDVRVIFLKLADRLHNMRTLNYILVLPGLDIFRESVDILAAVADFLDAHTVFPFFELFDGPSGTVHDGGAGFVLFGFVSLAGFQFGVDLVHFLFESCQIVPGCGLAFLHDSVPTLHEGCGFGFFQVHSVPFPLIRILARISSRFRNSSASSAITPSQ